MHCSPWSHKELIGLSDWITTTVLQGHKMMMFPFFSLILPAWLFVHLHRLICKRNILLFEHHQPKWLAFQIYVTSVQSLSRVRLVTPWVAAHQAPLSFTISWSLLKFRSIQLMMLSNHLILCCPLFPLLSIFPSIRVFSSALCIRWPKN